MVTIHEIDRDLFLIDTGFLGHECHNGVYVLNERDPVLIDTATSNDVDLILDSLREIGLGPSDIQYIIVSHLHLDHAGGAGFLVDRCPNARVVCHERAVRFLTDPDSVQTLINSAHEALGELADDYGTLRPIPEGKVQPVAPGDELTMGNSRLRCLEAGGHAYHQLCLHDPSRNFLFVADELGMWVDNHSLPSTPPPGFYLDTTLEDCQKFKTCNPDYLIYPHFGCRRSPIKAIDDYRGVLLEWMDSVRESWERRRSYPKVVKEMIGRDSDFYDIWDERSARETIKTNTLGALQYLEGENQVNTCS